MNGTPCPACGTEPVPFGRFICEVESDTTLACPGCAANLGRSRATHAVLAGLGLLFGLAGYLLVRATLVDPDAAGLVVLALSFVVAPPAYLLAAKFIAWRFVPWRLADARRPREAGPAEHA